MRKGVQSHLGTGEECELPEQRLTFPVNITLYNLDHGHVENHWKM